MTAQYETKLLDKNYIETQIASMPEIRKGLYMFEVRKSDNKNSNSLYVSFLHELSNGYLVRGNTLRISDHHARWDGLELIVDPKSILGTKKKKALMNCLKVTLNKSKLRIAKYCSTNVKKFNEKDNW